MEKKDPKKFLKRKARLCSTEAALVSIVIHVLLLISAGSIVAVRWLTKPPAEFAGEEIDRPKLERRKLQMPVSVKNMQKKSRRPQIKSRMTAVVPSNFSLGALPQINLGQGYQRQQYNIGLGDVSGLGFAMPKVNFFGAKAKGEKIVFVVHFGPATINDGGGGEDKPDDEPKGTPFSRMTGLAIRNRLADIVNSLPGHTLFNVACYWAGDTDAIHPQLMLATRENKKMVMDWMESVNPLEGDYDHNFVWKNAESRIDRAKKNWPTRVDNLPFYSIKWAYPYVVPPEKEKEYAPTAPNGIMHWGRGVSWAILEQKADTIFVLTTNYIDGWRTGTKEEGNLTEYQPAKMADALEAMCLRTYGMNKKKWPTINVVVLAKAGKDPDTAYKVLNDQFGKIWRTFKSDGSVIEDIKDFMTQDERELYNEYRRTAR
ncbi:MAG: hypothetical protein K9M45_05665 [Kiritimatiellales bacterium]|nr:hypothetical protein [Kiritimatiellales bacterium]